MVLYIANAFSLSMLNKKNVLMIDEVSPEYVKELLSINKFTSAIGHESTAQLLTQLLGVEIKAKRIAIKLNERDTVIVFQLMTRLPEGKVLSTEELQQLIQQGQAKFYMVYVMSSS